MFLMKLSSALSSELPWHCSCGWRAELLGLQEQQWAQGSGWDVPPSQGGSCPSFLLGTQEMRKSSGKLRSKVA